MRIPDATYRIQLDAAFDLARARELVPYLERLGVSHLYTSPVLQAREGSAHGYDVVDPRSIDRARGGEAALVALADDLHGRGLGLLVDTVRSTFPPHEHDHFIAHYRGLLGMWMRDEENRLNRV